MTRGVLGLALWLALAPPAAGAEKGSRNAPSIFVGGIVNAAGFAPAPDNALAPNTILAIFGVDLALRTRAVTSSDLRRGELPRELGGVTVTIGNIRAPLYFVSPKQINAQAPAVLAPGQTTVRVTREGLNSPAAEVEIREAAPGLFPVIAHQDFRIVGRGAPDGSTPARPGQVVVFFGSGFGPTFPPVREGVMPKFTAPVTLPARAWLDGREVAPENLLYVGQSPGFAGLYQVNLQLEEGTPAGDLEFVLEIDGRKSQPLLLPVERE